MTTGRELARPEDVAAVRDEVNDLLKRGDSEAAERALAVYAPPTQALIVCSTFVDALARAQADGLSSVDATHQAAQEAEKVIEAVPSESAADAVGAVDDQVLGAILGARAGDAHSSVAELVDPERVEAILAHIQELWTTAARRALDDPGVIQVHDDGREEVHASGDIVNELMAPERGERERNIPDPQQLLKVLWTIFQVEDVRAREILGELPLDLVAIPFADAFARQQFADDRTGEADDGDSDADLADDKPRRRLFSDGGPRLKPSDISFLDASLMEFRDRLREISPDRCEEVIIRAAAMSERLGEILEDIGADAEERARGEAAVVPSAATTDDMFTPLDAPGSDKEPTGH